MTSIKRWLVGKLGAMKLETLTEEPTLVIRRMILDPGEAMFWHRDQCRRFTVVVSGERLRIEYKDSASPEEFAVHGGMTGWDEPQPRTHRAVNAGSKPYEEIVSFYRDSVAVDPQPKD